MSRTFRRRSERHEYAWVLRDFDVEPFTRRRIDAHSRAGRKEIARFHSDREITMASAAPRWYRRLFKRKFNTLNDRQLRRWLNDPGYDPVFEPRHLHSANWSWW